MGRSGGVGIECLRVYTKAKKTFQDFYLTLTINLPTFPVKLAKFIHILLSNNHHSEICCKLLQLNDWTLFVHLSVTIERN